MGSKGWASDLTKMEDKISGHIKDNKKIMDTGINAILMCLSKMEKDMETWQKEKEEWEKARTQWEEEKIAMQEQLETMKAVCVKERFSLCMESMVERFAYNRGFCHACRRIIDFGSAMDAYTLQNLYGSSGPTRHEQTEEYTPPESFLQRNWWKKHGIESTWYAPFFHFSAVKCV
ncbi:hypothetical protein L7F22_018453 [Adiantum nelumboides]|nr:hypothetical protein [Adiantum nelumboides]